MSLLFHKRTRAFTRIIGGAIAILVTVGMVVFFSPGFYNYFLSR